MNHVVIVSGLPRSGTSLLMQMLVAGGIPALTDGVRQQDINNQRGYFEYEPVKKLAQDSSWLGEARGKAVKIITQLLPHLPAELPCRILMMERPLDEIVESQNTMLGRMGRQPAASPQTLTAAFARQRDEVLNRLRTRPECQLLPVPFHDLIRRAPGLIDQIIAFLERPGLDRDAMLNAIDPGLHRTRSGAVDPAAAPVPAGSPRLPWQEGRTSGLVVVSVPKSGTNFLSRYLSRITGWPHRWGRPSRDKIRLLDELPPDPDDEVARRALHLIQTEQDIMRLPAEARPSLFGNRLLVSLEPEPADQPQETADSSDQPTRLLIAEHPVRSLPWFLRNPSTVPVLQPQEVTAEAAALGFGVVFLHRNLKDIVNSLAHFLHAGTRFVHFRSLDDAMEVCVHHYAPVLARAIRTWQTDFSGVRLTYEELTRDTRNVLQRLIREFDLPVTTSRLIDSSEEFRTFTFRKGGSGDWRNHLAAAHVAWLDEQFPDLTGET